MQNDQISTLLSTIIPKLLVKNSNELIRLKTCVLINNLSKVHGIQQRNNNFTDDKTIQGEINYYLSCCASGNNLPLDKQSIVERSGYQFRHVCVEWKANDADGSVAKRLKIDAKVMTAEDEGLEKEESSSDDVSEILARIKGELKCLERVCKNRNLSQDNSKTSRRNALDIRAIITKLESFLN